MKKAAIAILIASTIGLSACQQQEVDVMKVEQLELQSDQQKQAYAFGANVGSFVKRNIEEQERVGITVDTETLVKGFVAGMQGESQLDEAQIKEILTALQTAQNEAKQALESKATEENLAIGQAYLAENGKREGVTTTNSGLQYEVITAGEGASPVATDTVKVHYRGTLLDGTEFDSSYSRGEPAVFPLNRVISGWTEGVQLMKVGAKYKFHIPANLAYGARATGKITANSTLIFDVELLEIETVNQEQ